MSVADFKATFARRTQVAGGSELAAILAGSPPGVLSMTGGFPNPKTFPTGEQYGIVFPNGSPNVEAVNEALAAIKEDGTLDEIYQEWFQKEAPQSVIDSTHDVS